jgi:chorismate dehydratase
MNGPVRISAVSYLNTAPFVHGIRHRLDPSLYELVLDIPAVCAEKLLSGKADLGLVPVAVIPLLKAPHIVSDYCIGAEGPVRSVMLYSDVPLDEIRRVLLDNQSRTSVQLTRVLARELWNIAPEWVEAKPGYETGIGGTTAGVVIGDRTFALNGKFAYAFDLAEAWQSLTGLPFVFACWVSNTALPAEFLRPFNEALRYGLSHRAEAAADLDRLPADLGRVNDYLEHCISYELTEKKKEGLRAFLARL